jgi:hypothetical protein
MDGFLIYLGLNAVVIGFTAWIAHVASGIHDDMQLSR